MTKGAYYNEIDPYAAQWLRNLIAAGHIAPGEVDERSIVDVRADDLRDFTQCHFFAGIGGWSHALRLAGWSDSRPVWTGSCPCQPFSAAGRRGGFDDARHLWPEFFRLIAECGPRVVFGEQVASKDGLRWLDLVQADMEGADYAFAALDLCAAGIGSPHIRQRLWWVGHAAGKSGKWIAGDVSGAQAPQHGEGFAVDGRLPVRPEYASAGMDGLADAQRGGLEGGRERPATPETSLLAPDSGACGLGQSNGGGPSQGSKTAAPARHGGALEPAGGGDRPGPTNGFWGDADWLFCRDGKWRPVEPGTFPLAHGVPGRVGRLRAYGNAIVPQVAAEVISAYMEISQGRAKHGDATRTTA